MLLDESARIEDATGAVLLAYGRVEDRLVDTTLLLVDVIGYTVV